ncbi:unnamed protein product [Notodromas monacha]|uniref:Uncharacterized protein n=1 Tax=Notodromas monacha TaxID=399045 RepID=A0A7R9GBX9_9CRUS|nr:unnamed protein product [Notodromas monacha]CAG0915266.1 unnamed protein product [Notodromas monacha]
MASSPSSPAAPGLGQQKLPRTFSTSVLRIKHRSSFWEKIYPELVRRKDTGNVTSLGVIEEPGSLERKSVDGSLPIPLPHRARSELSFAAASRDLRPATFHRK